MLDDLDSYKRDFDGWLGRHGVKLLGRRTTGIVEGLLDLGALKHGSADTLRTRLGSILPW